MNLQPKVSDGWPRAGYPTMAHAAFVAGMFNTLIRQGDTVRQAHQRDNTLYHRPYVNDTRPVNPGNYVQKFYAEPFTDGREWHHVPADVDGPTFTLPSMGHRIRRTEDVPSLDATAVHSDDGETVVVYAVNRNLRTARDVEFDVADRPSERCEPAEVPLVLIAGKDDDPFARHTSWTETNGFVCREDTLRPDDDGLVRLSMPPASVVRLEFDRGVSRDAE